MSTGLPRAAGAGVAAVAALSGAAASARLSPRGAQHAGPAATAAGASS
jgi:hypothetical protein